MSKTKIINISVDHSWYFFLNFIENVELCHSEAIKIPHNLLHMRMFYISSKSFIMKTKELYITRVVWVFWSFYFCYVCCLLFNVKWSEYRLISLDEIRFLTINYVDAEVVPNLYTVWWIFMITEWKKYNIDQ
jgi:hypothetical protein